MTRRYVLAAGLCVGAGALICALVVAAISKDLSAGPGEDAAQLKARIDAQLAVQKALQEGLDQIQRGNFQVAVFALEKEIARIDGNRKYLEALATAYRGHIRELQQANRDKEVEVYRKRLEILDPGSRLERPTEAVAIRPDTSPKGEREEPVSGNAGIPVKPVAALPANPEPAPPAKQPVKEPVKPAAGPGAQPAIARAKLDEPTADASRKSAAEAAALVERATQEFVSKHYAEAGRYYEQAHKIDNAATAACQEQWAYCRMFTASEAVHRGPATSAAAQDLEREIRQAMAMTPKLESFGKSLLKCLQAGKGDAALFPIDENLSVEMRHTPRQGQGWAMVETANFRVLHNQPKEVAERAARVAEATRLAMSRKWFGDDGEVWNPRCDIYLFANADDYSRETKTTARSPGHSTMNMDCGRVIARRIDLHVDHAETFNSVLPHEATHVVLAGRFDVQVPRWADEGMAVLTEPPNRVDRYLRNLPRHDQDHLLFGVGQLMRLNDYPDARSVDPFYTQSVSLVDFLSKEKGPRQFTAFLRDGLHDGYEPALRKHYHIENFGELERRWRAFAFADPQPATTESGK